jgi:hypothetical protein
MDNRKGKASAKRLSRSKEGEPESRSGDVYGYLLTIRALAQAAIDSHRVTPAMLRVLCVMAEYMDKNGQCRIGQETIAARLNISRQAVNRHITSLDAVGSIWREQTPGKADRYFLGRSGLEDPKTGRHGVERVEERRAAKRAAKRVAQKDEP